MTQSHHDIEETLRRLSAICLVLRWLLSEDEISQVIQLYETEFPPDQPLPVSVFVRRLADITHFDPDTCTQVSHRLSKALLLTATQIANYQDFEDQWLLRGDADRDTQDGCSYWVPSGEV